MRYARGNSTSSFGLGLEAVGSAVEGEASEGAERSIEEQNLSWWPRARRRLQKAAAADALRRNFTTFVKQLSGTYSILVNLPWVLDIKFPDLYERVLNQLALVNVDFSFSVECVMSRKVTFQDRLLAATIGPVAAVLFVIASVGISRHSSATPIDATKRLKLDFHTGDCARRALSAVQEKRAQASDRAEANDDPRDCAARLADPVPVVHFHVDDHLPRFQTVRPTRRELSRFR